jgi:swainsonine biosynthesis oxidoreductase SwnR
MKVAVAGTGNLAQYLIEEFAKYGHTVVILTRSRKQHLNFDQREIDYSVPSLVSALHDCDALVSTIADFINPPVATKIQLSMLEACEKTNCKTFIPSEWTLNVEDYPEQPMFLKEHNRILHHALTSSQVRSTIICCCWFADYVVPRNQRHLRDVFPAWPMDWSTKTFTILGPGTQPVNFTSCRDIAKAVAVLLESKEPWEMFTYISGEQLTWNELFAVVKAHDSEWRSKEKPLADTVNQLFERKSDEDVMFVQFEVQSYAGALALPEDRVQRHREKYFKGLHFRSIRELMTEAAENHKKIV